MGRTSTFLYTALSVALVSSPALAQDERAFRAAGVATTSQSAIVEAYYQGLARELARFAGAQAEGDVGKQFRRDFERDFATFKQRYFTPDTDHRCVARETRFSCEVEGAIKVLAVQTDFNKIMKTTERTLSNSLTFVVSAAESKDRNSPLVVEKLTGSFIESGYKVLSGSAVNAAITNGSVDFSLGILGLEFSPVQFDAGEQRASGSLTVRFRVNDIKGKTQVASVPVTVSDTVAGPSLSVTQADLTAKLAGKAAVEISRKVNASLVSFQVDKGDAAAAQQRMTSGQKLYLIRLEGVAQKDREKIKLVRDLVASQVRGATAQVDPSQSNATRVTLSFGVTGTVDTENLIDALYAQHKHIPSFEATYAGNNEFIVHY